ncbi:MAG: hypothetical protein L3V56_13225 [Candidatus Magnetoovum sp. WYHC-5]|nr:hypothetical protein [Candidatus Magnetoovum sp. WYHC-5]
MIKILDTTLREGEQSRGVSFSLEQKIEIARLLDEFGVDYIEAGHPAVSTEMRNTVTTISSLGLRAEIVAHARAKIEDIKAAIECKVPWVGIFIGINEVSLKYKYNLQKSQVYELIRISINYAKDNGLKVRLTIEDATRTETAEIIELCQFVDGLGVDRISIADTVGVAVPSMFYNLIRQIKAQTKVDLHVHCHNDFGMAVANAIAAFEGGAVVIDTAVNGLGERAGIATLAEVCTALYSLFGIRKGWRLDLLPFISKQVALFANIPLNPKMPIVGDDAFYHKGKLHVNAVSKYSGCYEPISPEIVGRQELQKEQHDK